MEKYNEIILLKSDRLALSDRRLFNYLLHHAFNRLKTQTNFSVKLASLQGVFSTSTPSLESIKESLCRLQRLIVNLETNEKKNTWIQTPLLSTVEIDTKNKKLHYSYTSIACKLLTQPEALEQLLIQAHFEYKYSIALYKLLAISAFDQKTEYRSETLDLRNYLNIPEGKLKSFNDFNRFALQPALKEINAYASFTTTLATTRKGRKVTHLNFRIQAKREIQKLKSAKHVIPGKRPQIFIDDPEQVKLYSRILMADTTERKKYFSLAKKNAKDAGTSLHDDDFDMPDKWFEWINKID